MSLTFGYQNKFPDRTVRLGEMWMVEAGWPDGRNKACEKVAQCMGEGANPDGMLIGRKPFDVQ